MLRKPIVWWLLVLIVGAITAGFIDRLAGDAAAARDGWGATERVAVAAEPFDVGQRVATVVEWVDYPKAVVPAGAIREIENDAVARVAVGEGEMIVRTDVVPDGQSLAASLPVGTAAVAVPRGAGWPDLAVGDHVDLLAPAASGDPITRRVARSAVVVGVDERLVTVAVANGEIAEVAWAITRSEIVAALVR